MYEVWTDASTKPKKYNKKNRVIGCSSIGVVVKKNGNIIHSHSSYIGNSYDNNQAEYAAFIYAVNKIIEMDITDEVVFYTDSNVVEKQINGTYQAKSSTILNYYEESIKLIKNLNLWKVKWIPRELNREADKLAAECLNERE